MRGIYGGEQLFLGLEHQAPSQLPWFSQLYYPWRRVVARLMGFIHVKSTRRSYTFTPITLVTCWSCLGWAELQRQFPKHVQYKAAENVSGVWYAHVMNRAPRTQSRYNIRLRTCKSTSNQVVCNLQQDIELWQGHCYDGGYDSRAVDALDASPWWAQASFQHINCLLLYDGSDEMKGCLLILDPSVEISCALQRKKK